MAGYQLELLSVLYQARYPHQMQLQGSLVEQIQITQEVLELLSKGALNRDKYDPRKICFPIFLIEKKGGEQRPVVNLNGLNQFVRV